MDSDVRPQAITNVVVDLLQAEIRSLSPIMPIRWVATKRGLLHVWPVTGQVIPDHKQGRL